MPTFGLLVNQQRFKCILRKTPADFTPSCRVRHPGKAGAGCAALPGPLENVMGIPGTGKRPDPDCARSVNIVLAVLRSGSSRTASFNERDCGQVSPILSNIGPISVILRSMNHGSNIIPEGPTRAFIAQGLPRVRLKFRQFLSCLSRFHQT